MKKTARETVEYRYYEMPSDIPVLALLGEGWIRPYGELGLKALHFHNHLEIGYCYEGHGTLVIEDEMRPYQPETYSVIPHYMCHTTVSDNGMLCRCEYLFIDVEAFLASAYPENGHFAEHLARLVNQRAHVGNASANPKTGRLILSLIEELREKNPFYLVSVRGLLLALLIELARAAEDEGALFQELIGAQNLAIMDALHYITNAYGEEIKIEALAEACHMSEAHFRRIFREIMSITPLEYINIVRIEMACNMLRSTDYSMKTVARRAGFPIMTTFNRNFRRVTNCTPLQWKKSPSNYEQKLRNYRIAAFQGWR